jgi:hypothetical protein
MPVLVDENGVVIAGHARLGAAAKLKLTLIPVIVAREWIRALPEGVTDYIHRSPCSKSKPFSRGTGSSNPSPSSAESATNLVAAGKATFDSRSRPILLQTASAAIMVLSLRTENTNRRHAAL